MKQTSGRICIQYQKIKLRIESQKNAQKAKKHIKCWTIHLFEGLQAYVEWLFCQLLASSSVGSVLTSSETLILRPGAIEACSVLILVTIMGHQSVKKPWKERMPESLQATLLKVFSKGWHRLPVCIVRGVQIGTPISGGSVQIFSSATCNFQAFDKILRKLEGTLAKAHPVDWKPAENWRSLPQIDPESSLWCLWLSNWHVYTYFYISDQKSSWTSFGFFINWLGKVYVEPHLTPI